MKIYNIILFAAIFSFHSTFAQNGISTYRLYKIDSIVLDGIHKKAFPGCQVVVLKDGIPIYDKCFGKFTYNSAQKVLPTTMYDLASLSKTTGTLLAIMKLYDEGKLNLKDKISCYLPFLIGTNKETLTIQDLLFHETGLPGSILCYKLVVKKKDVNSFTIAKKDTTAAKILTGLNLIFNEEWVSTVQTPEFVLPVANNLFVHRSLHTETMKKIAAVTLKSKTYLYSCVNFILLKEIAETISNTTLDKYLDQEFYSPMKLKNICYLPLRTHNKDQITPTLQNDFLRNGIIQGYVHDPDAAFLGGISGNAGLFATAHDVAMVYQMLLNNGELEGRRYLSEETCKLFTSTVSATKRRGLGFDKAYPANPAVNPCCLSAPSAVYGHTGYTGTCCWVDPQNKLVYVFLSNRTYPNDAENKLAKMRIRPKIQEAIYNSLSK